MATTRKPVDCETEKISDARFWPGKLVGTIGSFGYDVIVDKALGQNREQVRFPRSKRKRIRKKWRKDPRNWRTTYDGPEMLIIVENYSLGSIPDRVGYFDDLPVDNRLGCGVYDQHWPNPDQPRCAPLPFAMLPASHANDYAEAGRSFASLAWPSKILRVSDMTV